MRPHEIHLLFRFHAAAVIMLTGITTLCACEGKQAPAPPPVEVVVTEAVRKDVPVFMEIVGQTMGSQDVEIRARVEGYLEKVAFTEGSFVHKGDLLYLIDPKPLQAALSSAKADLATARARLQKTENDVARLTPLAAEQAVSQQELDNAQSQRDAARAQVDATRAAVDKAQLDLGYATITSPIDGLVGTTNVKAGNLVGRGESTLLTTVSVVDPILFRAGISEAEYLRLARRADEIRQERGGRKLPITLILADETIHPITGHVEAIERAVDPTTGTLMLQFSFPNPKELIRPGQYGRVRAEVSVLKDALLVPQRAAAGGSGTAESLPPRDCRAGQQSGVPQRQGGPAPRWPLGDYGGPEPGRQSRGRRVATHP